MLYMLYYVLEKGKIRSSNDSGEKGGEKYTNLSLISLCLHYTAREFLTIPAYCCKDSTTFRSSSPRKGP